MTPEAHLRHLADRIRATAEIGLHHADGKPHDRERYEHLRGLAAELFAFTDERDAAAVEQEVFTQLTHFAPVTVGDAAVFDDEGRVLLIQRADDRLWAMPGGLIEVGESPAEGVAREAREEAGVDVEVTALAGVYDSRFCEPAASIQMHMFVFACRPVAFHEPTTPHEVLDIGWFTEHELPALSRGHQIRVPDAFAFTRHGRPHWDRPA